jgi:hypothetical protein
MGADLDIRPLTVDDDLDAFGRIVLESNLALPDMPRDVEYEVELADVAARVRDDVVFGAFVGETPAGCVTFVADASSPQAATRRRAAPATRQTSRQTVE